MHALYCLLYSTLTKFTQCGLQLIDSEIQLPNDMWAVAGSQTNAALLLTSAGGSMLQLMTSTIPLLLTCQSFLEKIAWGQQVQRVSQTHCLQVLF